MIRGDYKLAPMDEMRGIPEQNSALVEGLPHKTDVPLGEIPHAPVNELGAPARSPVREVERLEQQRAVTA
jgi:hypothetical protein